MTPFHGVRVPEWQLKTRKLTFGALPSLMGIVNVTPDSFSDGGQFISATAAVDHALGLVEAGATILDVGGESTRPYSEPVPAQEELRRVLPVLEQLAVSTEVPISIDTSKAEVARQAIELGAEIVNDVTGCEGDPDMIDVVADTAPGVCVMHMQGTPATMQDAPEYADVIAEVLGYLKQRAEILESAGISASRICLDPGIGFGKTRAHNFELLRGCAQLTQLGYPTLVGHSRKGFISKLVGDDCRIFGTVAVALALARQGVQVIRVHDVAAVQAGLQMFAAAGGMDESHVL